MPECGCGWDLAGFAARKAAGRTEYTRKDWAPLSSSCLSRPSPQRSPHWAAAPHRRSSRPDSTHGSPLSPRAADKCYEILGELSLTAAPSPLPSLHIKAGSSKNTTQPQAPGIIKTFDLFLF